MPARKRFNPSSSGVKTTKEVRSLRHFRTTNKGSVDWVKRGYVNAVQNQGVNSYCWIITALAAVEALYMIKMNVNIKLAEQEIIENYYLCYEPSIHNPLGKYGSLNGCFEYIKEHGISMSKDWDPYTRDGEDLAKPKQKPNPQAAISITDYAIVSSEESILAALNFQPLVGAMYVTQELKDLERGKIYQGEGESITDCMHAVLIVGYGTDYGTDEETQKKYYKIQNSWGTGWGDDGYARVERYLVKRVSYPIDIK